MSGSTGKSNDEIVMEIAIDISEKLTNRIGFDQAHSTITKIDTEGRLPSLSTVLLQELDRFNKLLEVIHSSLNDLRKAIKGVVVMSAELEGVYTSFINNAVIYIVNFTINSLIPIINKINILDTENMVKKSIPFVEDFGQLGERLETENRLYRRIQLNFICKKKILMFIKNQIFRSG